MPVAFGWEPETGVVRAEMTGVIRRRDVLDHATRLAEAGLFARPQILDARRAAIDLTPADAERLAEEIARLRRIHGHARTAVITLSAPAFATARVYQGLSGTSDPGFAVFATVDEAERWAREPLPESVMRAGPQNLPSPGPSRSALESSP